ncbi:MAG: OmpH family outer membrane protein [Bacteroidota bacterium]|jgi:Skp family chaperone for outer membrane proteins
MKQTIINILLAVAFAGLLIYLIIDKSNQSTFTFIDVNKTIKEFKLTKEYESKMEFTDQKRKQILDSLRFDAEIASRQLLNDSANTKLQEVFVAKRDLFLSKEEQFNKDQQMQLQEYNNQVLKQINQFAVDFRKENNYPVILGASGNGSIMAADPRYDVTDQFVAYINTRYNGKQK